VVGRRWRKDRRWAGQPPIPIRAKPARPGGPSSSPHNCDTPPSTGSSAPVVYVASKARKATALAISSERPRRFMGVFSAITTIALSASSRGIDLVRTAVSIGPGLTALTRIPRGRSSVARVRAIERSAALPAE